MVPDGTARIDTLSTFSDGVSTDATGYDSRMRTARRIADRGLALAGELLTRGLERGARLVEDAVERRRRRPAAAPPRPGPSPRSPGAEAARVALAEPPAWTPSDTSPVPPSEPEEHVSEEAVLVEVFGDERVPGAEVEIAEPWDGYDEMTARDIVKRVRDAGSELAAAVRRYEAANKNRVTVLDATERALKR